MRAAVAVGRTGQAFTPRGVVNIRNARHADDPRPLDEGCDCPACRGYSRAYLHHVSRAKEIIASMLMTWHNLRYYQTLMAQMREAIAAGRFAQWEARFREDRARGDVEPLCRAVAGPRGSVRSVKIDVTGAYETYNLRLRRFAASASVPAQEARAPAR